MKNMRSIRCFRQIFNHLGMYVDVNFSVAYKPDAVPEIHAIAIRQPDAPVGFPVVISQYKT